MANQYEKQQPQPQAARYVQARDSQDIYFEPKSGAGPGGDAESNAPSQNNPLVPGAPGASAAPQAVTGGPGGPDQDVPAGDPLSWSAAEVARWAGALGLPFPAVRLKSTVIHRS